MTLFKIGYNQDLHKDHNLIVIKNCNSEKSH